MVTEIFFVLVFLIRFWIEYAYGFNRSPRQESCLREHNFRMCWIWLLFVSERGLTWRVWSPPPTSLIFPYFSSSFFSGRSFDSFPLELSLFFWFRNIEFSLIHFVCLAIKSLIVCFCILSAVIEDSSGIMQPSPFQIILNLSLDWIMWW